MKRSPWPSLRSAARVLLTQSLLSYFPPGAGSATAQAPTIDLAIASAPSPVGAGARAAGVASAFVAVADDATAASWNPAGLVQLERPEVSAVGRVGYHIDDFDTTSWAFQDQSATTSLGASSIDTQRLNYLSAALPFAWRNRNVVVSINYHETLSFDRLLDIHTTASGTDVATDVRYRFEQDGSLYAVSPSIAVELTPDISIGTALNYWFDGFGRSYAWRFASQETFVFRFQGETTTTHGQTTKSFEDFRGVGATFGLMVHPVPRLSIGSVVNIPFVANLRWSRHLVSETRDATATDPLSMQMPLSFALGAAYRTSDRFLLSVDWTRVEWGDFRLSDRHGNEYLVSGDPTGPDTFRPPTDQATEYRVAAVDTVRLGAEYLIPFSENSIAMRAGVFYDPEPSRGAPETFVGGSVGLGFTRPDWSLDLAYQLRMGLGADGLAVIRSVLEVPGGEIDVYDHNFFFSLIYYV